MEYPDSDPHSTTHKYSHTSRETHPAAPICEHNGRHTAIADYLASADSSEEG